MMAHGFGRVELSHPDKVLFPDCGVTKRDLLDYYVGVGETMLRHLRGRPLTLQRYPDGIEGEGFYQKRVPARTPDWVHRTTVRTAEGHQRQLTAQSRSSLAFLVDQACITLHVWLSREPDLDHPDRIVFDVDPPAGAPFGRIREAARRLGELMREIDLVPFVQTTGSRGLHVVVPIRPERTFDEVRAFARGAAEVLVRRQPRALTLEVRKTKRGDRVYLDVMRNARGQTAVAPYAVRAREGAPVATPLEWDELDDPDLDARRWRLENILRRLGARDDPWADIARRARRLDEGRQRALVRLGEKATA
jgi:bifunctional non-homologous end joining protein LigD